MVASHMSPWWRNRMGDKGDVWYDFQKLLVARADVRVMIFDAPDVFEELRAHVVQVAQMGDRYVFARYLAAERTVRGRSVVSSGADPARLISPQRVSKQGVFKLTHYRKLGPNIFARSRFPRTRGDRPRDLSSIGQGCSVPPYRGG